VNGYDPRNDPAALSSARPIDEVAAQLRALAQPAAADRDLWPGIEARLATTIPRSVPGPRRHATPPRRRAGWLALAASLLVAAGLARQHTATDTGQPRLATGAPAPPSPPSPAMLQRQADAMTLEYAAALREVQASHGAPLSPEAVAELDRSARTIRAALAEDPESRFLLDHLRRVYARQLDLTRRST